jgi:hypothetical protein
MVFVPSVGCYSHCEKGFIPTDQCARGVDVILNIVFKLDETLNA